MFYKGYLEMTQVTVHDNLETIKVLLTSGDLEAKKKFTTELVKGRHLDLVKTLTNEDLLETALLENIMIRSIEDSVMPFIRHLYSLINFNISYVVAAAAFKQIEPILFFGIHSDHTEQMVALVFLAGFGCLDHVKTLVDLGVAVNGQAFDGACAKGHLEIVKFLLSRFDINPTHGLCEAIENHQSDVIKHLIDLEKPFDHIEVARKAATVNYPDLLQQMITLAKNKQHNINFYALSEDLMEACLKGHHKVIELLLKEKVPLTTKVYSQLTEYDTETTKLLADQVIQGAILREDLEIVKYLGEYLNYVNLDTAIERAILVAKNLDMVRILTTNQPFNLTQAILHAISVDHADMLVYLTALGPFDIETAIQLTTLKGSNQDILGHLLLTRVGVTFTTNDTEDSECCVCLTPSEVKVEPCKHVVCSTCLHNIVIQGINLTCPMCRGSLISC
jgi:ankyrin repeat protein